MAILDVTNLSELVLEGGLGIGTSTSATFGNSGDVLVSGGSQAVAMTWTNPSGIITSLNSLTVLAGLAVGSNASIAGTLTQVGAATFSSTITVAGTSTFKDNLLAGASNLQIGTSASAASRFSVFANAINNLGTFYQTDTATFSSSVFIGASLTVGLGFLASSAATFTGPTNALGSATVNLGFAAASNSSFAGTSTFVGASTFSSSVNVAGSLTVALGFSAASNSSFAGTTTTIGAATFSSSVNIAGSASVGLGFLTSSAATFTGPVNALGSATVNLGFIAASTSMHVGAATFSSTVNVTGSCSFATTTAHAGNATFSGTISQTSAAASGVSFKCSANNFVMSIDGSTAGGAGSGAQINYNLDSGARTLVKTIGIATTAAASTSGGVYSLQTTSTAGVTTQAHRIDETGVHTIGASSSNVHVFQWAETTSATNGTITVLTLALGYLTATVNGRTVKIPFYAN